MPVEQSVVVTEFERVSKTHEYKMFWASNSKRAKLFNLLVQGKSIPEIQKEIHVQIDFIKRTCSNQFFLKKLEAYLLQLLFNYQVNRIVALDETFKLFWDATLGRKSIQDLSVDQAAKHLIKLLEMKELPPKVINPKQFNIIMNIIKSNPKVIPDMSKEFGFDKLKTLANSNERSDENIKLDTGEGNPN